MPKKFIGENSKAAESKARKAAKKEEDDFKKQKEIEEEYWKDDDKHAVKKLLRKDEKEKKKNDQLQRKKELQQLADEEMDNLAKSTAKIPPSKVTRAQADQHKKAIDEATQGKKKSKEEVIEENINQMKIEGSVAQDVDEAIHILGSGPPDLDMHPEKRMKAAYLVFEERSLPLLKADNPSMRLSQLKQMLRKEWIKSPDNPINQALKLSAIN